MAFLVDLTGEYDYKPVWTPPPVSPITPSYDQQQSLPYTEPAPAPTVLDPNKWAGNDPVGDDVAVAQNGGSNDGSVWNSVFQAWEKDGRLWDSESGLWFTMPSYGADPMVYREGVGDQSIPEYNDYNKVLQELYGGADGGGFAGNPLVAQPSIFQPKAMPNVSNADWTNIDAAMDRPTSVTPSAGWYNVDAALDPNRGTFPAADKYNPTFDQLNGQFAGQAPRTAQVGNTPGLSSILGGAQKFLNAGAETGRDLFEGGLQSTPITAFPLAAYDIARGRNPLEEAKNRLAGGGTFNNLAKPQDFIAQQNADLSNRGTVDELVTSTVFDPSNLIGAGFATKALKGAEGASALSKILRGAGAANEAIDAGTAKAFGAGAKYLGREALGAGVGVGANALAGGQDNTGLDWWQAGLIGALGGSATRKVGSGGISDLLAKAQGRTGLPPALGAQIDFDPVVTQVRDALKEARLRDDVPRIQQLRMELDGLGAPDTGFPSFGELNQIAADAIRSGIDDPAVKEVYDNATSALRDYDRLKALHQAAYEPEALGAGLDEISSAAQEAQDRYQRLLSEYHTLGKVTPRTDPTNIAAVEAKGAELEASRIAMEQAQAAAYKFNSRSMDENIALQQKNPFHYLSDEKLIAQIKERTEWLHGDVNPFTDMSVPANHRDYLENSHNLERLQAEAQKRGINVADALYPRRGEMGSASTNIALRTMLAGGAGGLGYLTADEDASNQEKFLRALAFGGAVAAGPEVIGKTADIAAKTYSKIPGLAERGAGHMKWLEDAPVSDALAGTAIDPIIPLKQDLGSVIPLRTRISNAFWSALTVVDKDKFATHIDDGRVRSIATMTEANARKIPQVAEVWVNEFTPDFAMFPADENGAILLNGQYVPVLDKNGLPVAKGSLIKEKAGMADLMRSKEYYLENGFIDQAQYDALNRIQSGLKQFHELQGAFGLTPDPDLRIDPANGAYYPFGRPTDQLAEDIPRKPSPGRKIGVEPGSSKTRVFDSIGAGINQGKKYPKPADAAKQYITEVLAQVNAENATRNLEKIGFEAELRDGKQYITLGDLRPDKTLKTQLQEQIKAHRELKKEVRKLSTRKERIDRDIRLGSRWVGSNRKRIETLNNALADTAIAADARANIAKEMLDLTRVSIRDAESAAKDYLKATAKTAVKDSEARKTLQQVLAEAKRVGAAMDELQGQIDNADLAELAMSGKFVDAWGYSDSIRAAVAQDASSLERVMNDLAQRHAVSDEARKVTQEALGNVQRQFSDELTHMRNLNREAADEATRNAVAAEQVRQALSGDKTRELDRVVTQRADQLKKATAKSQELSDEIDRLKDQMLPIKATKDQIKADIATTRKLAKNTNEVFKGKISGQGWGLAGWENTPLPAQIANSWRKVVTDTNSTSRIGDVYDFINNSFRLLGATADVSRTATVGALGFADNTKASVAGMRTGVDVIRQGPEAAAQKLRDIEATAKKNGINVPLTTAVGHDLQITTAEQFHQGFADAGSMADKFTKLPVIKQADIMYSVPANIERAQRFYDTLLAWKMAGKDYTSTRALSMAANAANTITGRSARGFGDILIGEKGASRTFFAARFVQSQIETAMNAILVGGVEGEEARRALLKLAIGGSAITYGVNQLNGSPTDWHPIKDGRINSNFMRMRVGDQDISIFGPWDSLFKGILSVYQRDPDYFLRSKLGPIPGMVADAAYGANAIGQAVSRNPLSKDMYTAENLLRVAPIPFGARSAIEIGRKTDWSEPKDVGNFALGAAASLTGVKSSPLTEREQYERILDGGYDEWKPESGLQYPKPASPMDDPLYLAEYASKHPDDVPGPSSAAGKEIKEIRDPIRKDIATNTTKFANGEKNLGDWKEARKELKAKERTALEHITKNFNGIDPPKDSPAYWLNEYFKTFDGATVDGLLDYNKLDTLQASLLSSAPEWVAPYIDEYFIAKADPGPERQYREALNQLNKDGYFSGEANSIPRYQGMVSDITDKEIDDYRNIIDDWSNRPEYSFLKGKSTAEKAVVIIGDYWDSKGQEFDPLIIQDIGNSAKDKFQSLDFKMYKLDHPELLAWLNPELSWETLQKIVNE